jgi:dienelactone hydrolase
MFVAHRLSTLLAGFYVVAALLSPAAADEDGWRVLAPGRNGLHPAVLLVPGCSGFAANNGINTYDARAAELQAAGFFVVYVDYVGKRMQSNCAHVGLSEVAGDIVEAATWAAGHAGVDPGRIFVIGWSYGAGGVLTMLRAAGMDAPVARAVMYYPVCRGAVPWSGNVSGLMLLGAADGIAYPNLCDAVAKGMPPEKLRVVTYPNARHGFDMRGLPENSASGASGYNEEAADASWATVMEFLK